MSRQQQQAYQSTDMTQQYINDRDQAMNQISKDIDNLAVIQKELNTMVYDQAQMVDDLDAHIDMADTAVEDGVQQLEQAADNAVAARKKKICLSIFCSILGLMVLGSILHYFFGGGSTISLIITGILIVGSLIAILIYYIRKRMTGVGGYMAARAAAGQASDAVGLN